MRLTWNLMCPVNMLKVLCFLLPLCFNLVTGAVIPLNRSSRYTDVKPSEFNCTGLTDGYFVHPSSCSEYYVCASGLSYKSECAPGLLFVESTTFCEKANLVTCTRQTMPTPKPTTTGVKTNELNCTGIANGYYVHPSSFSMYYACVGGLSYKFECLPGMLFLESSSYCEQADLVNCNRQTTPTTNPTTTETTTMMTVPTTKPMTTQKTTMMATNPMTTETTTIMTVPTTKPTTTETTTIMTVPTTKPTTTETTTMMTVPTTTETTTMMTVPTTKPTTETTTMMTVPTTKPTTTETTMMMTVPTTKPTTTETTTMMTTTTRRTTTETTTTRKTTPAPSGQVDCSVHGSGTLLRDPDDCTKYWECLRGTAIPFSCAGSTAFRLDILGCDYKYNVPECK